MQEYSRRITREYPPEFRREPGLTESTANIVLHSCFIWLIGSITLIWAETERYDIVHFSKVTNKSLEWIRWEQNYWWTLTWAKTIQRRCVFANRLSFSKLFDDILPMLNMRRLCVVVDSFISATKVCDCVISAWCWEVCDRVAELWLCQNFVYQPLILFRWC